MLVINKVINKKFNSYLINTIVCFLLSSNFAAANETVPLYVEDGNIQVSKIIRKNPLGGETVEYLKTRVAELKPQTVDEYNSAESAESATMTVEKPADTTIIDAKKAEQSDGVKAVSEVKLPSVMPKQGLTIKTELSQQQEKLLLEKVKAIKESKKISAINQDLKLAPGEELIEAKPAIKIQSKQTKNKKLAAKNKKAKEVLIGRLEFNNANIQDVSRALADISGLNFVATEEAGQKNVTVFLQNISVINALEAVTKNSGLWYRQDKDSGTFRIMTTEEYQRDLVVYREDITRVFNLLHPNPVNVATAVRDLYGDRVILSYGADFDDFFTGEFNSGASQSSFGSNRGSRSSANGAGLGRGQAGLRRGVTSGISRRNNIGMGGGQFSGGNNQNRQKVEDKAGTAGNMAITEKLSANQLERLEDVLQVDENGDLVVKGAIRGISRAQQPIYVTISRQQNLMIVRTSDAVAVKEIENLVKAMDKPTQQVLLEMQVLEVDVGDAYNQLFSFTALSRNGKSLAFTREDEQRNDSGKFVYQFIDDLIGLKLELLEQNRQARTVSSPVLLASNNRTARLFVGEERLLVRGATLTDAVLNQNGFIVTPARITYETEIRNVGNTLNITPKINADGTVTLGIFQDTSTINEDAVDFPPLVTTNGQVVNVSLDTVNTANIEGVVVAKDGLTVAIGGLISNSVSKEENKVPVLGDLPLIGNAFKDKFESVSKKEMVLLITPHIMKDPSVTDDISRDVVEPITVHEW